MTNVEGSSFPSFFIKCMEPFLCPVVSDDLREALGDGVAVRGGGEREREQMSEKKGRRVGGGGGGRIKRRSW